MLFRSEALEFQVRDRLSFMRFLGLDLHHSVPDATTIWLFREALVKAEKIDALFDLMDPRIVERALQTNEIEIAPLAFMRGRTLSNAVVILDEAQNTTSMQMKMFLTRLGENSRMIVTGDPSQIDLPSGQISGLNEATRLLANVEGIGHAEFSAQDVVRHELVGRIVAAYDKAAARRREAKE